MFHVKFYHFIKLEDIIGWDLVIIRKMHIKTTTYSILEFQKNLIQGFFDKSKFQVTQSPGVSYLGIWGPPYLDFCPLSFIDFWLLCYRGETPRTPPPW